MAKALIGIDGGGSGCRGRLMRRDGAVFEATAGPANAYSDLPGSAAAVTELEAALRREADWSGPAEIVAGIAGCRLSQIGAALSRALPFEARIVDDPIIAARGALGPSDGVLIGLGTGAFFARQSAGELRQISGWGFTLGDRGSGAWLGRAVVRAALRAEDGQSAHDSLTRTVMASGAHPLLRFAEASPADFAALAPLILDHTGSATAQRLLREIIAEIEAALLALETPDDVPLVLTGSLAKALHPFLPPHLSARLQHPLGDALDGALALAREASHA